MEQEKRIKILERALVREKAARKEAERLLEEKSSELYKISETQKQTNSHLQELLTERTSELEGVFVNIIDAYIVMDLTGNVLKMNDAAVELIGYDSSKEVFNLLTLIDEAQMEYTMKAFKELYNMGTYTNYRAVIKTKFGKLRTVQVNASIIYNGKGKAIGAQGIVHDITNEIAMKSLLQDQKKQLEIVIDNSPIGILLTGNEGKNVILANKAICKLLEFSEAEFKDMEVKDFTHPDDRPMTLKELKLFHEGEKDSATLEKRYVSKYGKTVWAKTSVTVVRDPLGMVKYHLATIEDVSKEKEQKEKLLESEARLSSLILNLQSGILLEDDEGKVVLANIQFCRLFKIPVNPEELVGMDCKLAAEQSKVLFKNPDTFIKRIDKLLTDKSICINEELELVDGRFFKRSYIPIFYEGESKGRLWSYEDITMEKNYELNLKIQKDKFSAIIDNMNLGLLEVDNNDAVMYANKSFVDISGYSREDLYGKKASETLMTSRFKRKIADKNNKRKLGISDSYEVEILTKEGELKHWLISGAPNYDSNGQLVGSIGVHLDITEKKNLELQKEQLLINLEKQNAQLNEFAHIVSHDLKSPLRSISALIAWTKEDFFKNMEEQSLTNLDLIEEKIERMDLLIENILKYSSIDNSQSQIEEVNLNTLMEDVLKMMYVPENVEIVVLKKLPIFYGDTTKIQQLFLNLLSNAVNHLDKPQGLIEIDYVPLDSHFQFSIKDNGKGIKEEDHQKIFEIFKTLDSSEKATGIGLSIVKKVLDLYHGEIWLESEVGVGTTFYFTMKQQ